MLEIYVVIRGVKKMIIFSPLIFFLFAIFYACVTHALFLFPLDKSPLKKKNAIFSS